MEIVTIETSEIGDRSYLVTDGRHALVVDPQRDVERITAAADQRGVRITHVVETHVHNDYLSGGLILARLTGARYGVAADEAVSFAAERDPLSDRDRFAVGELTVEVVATPGHTAHHLSYVVGHRTADGTENVAVFSGGSLLLGGAGRTDLAGDGLTETLARAQWASIRRLASSVPMDTTVHPTHGFGSFCSAGAGAGGTDDATIARQWTSNPALLLGQDSFVADLIGALTVYPRYYVHMAPRNRAGVPPPVTAPVPAGAQEILRRVGNGEWVVDVRPRRLFAARHLAGTVNVELGAQLATYLAWVFPWGSPLSLLAETQDQLVAARRLLARVGLEDVAAEGTFDPKRTGIGPIASYPVASFDDLEQSRGRDVMVLDVRHPHEWSAGHLPGAVHIPVQDLDGAMATLPRDRRVWVHCAAGYRAALASSLLDRRGISVTLIDDGWDQSRGRHLRTGTAA